MKTLIVALAVIAIATGTFAILSSMGINVAPFNALHTLTLPGGSLLVGAGAAGLLGICIQGLLSCRGRRTKARPSAIQVVDIDYRTTSDKPDLEKTAPYIIAPTPSTKEERLKFCEMVSDWNVRGIIGLPLPSTPLFEYTFEKSSVTTETIPCISIVDVFKIFQLFNEAGLSIDNDRPLIIISSNENDQSAGAVLLLELLKQNRNRETIELNIWDQMMLSARQIDTHTGRKGAAKWMNQMLERYYPEQGPRNEKIAKLAFYHQLKSLFPRAV